ncbi:response regulator transcription factor [Kineococcus glutinatus]|uniref:response regulator transcription factor n=1 Tax=Kineococcus glutinatus TaxID=1070872 RepID=UPI0031E71AF7
MRVVIAEDSVLLREGLVSLLHSEGVEVVAAVGGPEELLRAVAGLDPDLAVVDVRMPPTFTDEGIRAALVLRRQHPRTAVLVLSQYVEEHYAADLIAGRATGVGYLLKDRVADVDVFIRTLHHVAGGGAAVDPEVVAQLLSRVRRDDPVSRLTPRELDVLHLMAEGRSNSAIAAQLVVSDKAVEKHVSSIFIKLDLPPDGDDHRRVLAVLRYLDAAAHGGPADRRTP